MKVTDLKEKEVIHCETLEQYDAICQLLHEAGLKWADGSEYTSPIEFYTFNEKTAFVPKIGKYDDVKILENQGYIIHKATDFITPPQTKEEYAKERAIGFAEWAAIEYKYFVSKDNDYWVSSLNNYTTAELYDEYLKSINHE